MKKESEEKCTMPGCEREIKYPESGLCGRCYHWMYYWSRRTPADKMKRLRQLEFWEKRAKAVWERKNDE